MQKFTIDRRSFLQGAAGLAGVAAVGMPKLALAAGSGASSLYLSFWNGQNFQRAETISSGDRNLESIRLTIRSFGAGPISAIEVNGFDAADGSEDKTSFRAWSTKGAANARLVVGTIDGLDLTVFQGEGENESASRIVLSSALGGNAKLREGTYVLTSQNSSLSSFQIGRAGLSQGIESVSVAAPKQYLLLTVERI